MDNIVVKRGVPGDDEHRDNLVRYVLDERKIAFGGNGVNYNDPEAAIMQMREVTNYYDKSHCCSCVQMIMSFDESVKDAETAASYVKQAAQQIPDEYQTVYCVHEADRENNHYHGHIVINPVSTKDGKQFDTGPANIERISDEISRITGTWGQYHF